VEIVKLHWPVCQQENLRTVVVDVKILNTFERNIWYRNKPYMFFIVFTRDWKSTFSMFKRGHLPLIFLKRRYLEVCPRTSPMLHAHLILQLQLLPHAERFCPIIQNSFFDLALYLTENNLYCGCTGKFWPDITNIRTCSYIVSDIFVRFLTKIWKCQQIFQRCQT